jgi:hypothetical protein
MPKAGVARWLGAASVVVVGRDGTVSIWSWSVGEHKLGLSKGR